MKIQFSPKSLEGKYTNEKWLVKKYGPKIAKGLLKFLTKVEYAVSAYDLKVDPVNFMEHLKQDKKEYYSVSLDKKHSKWRLILQMLDEEGNVLVPTNNEKEFLKSIRTIRIKELSEHYVEY